MTRARNSTIRQCLDVRNYCLVVVIVRKMSMFSINLRSPLPLVQPRLVKNILTFTHLSVSKLCYHVRETQEFQSLHDVEPDHRHIQRSPETVQMKRILSRSTTDHSILWWFVYTCQIFFSKYVSILSDNISTELFLLDLAVTFYPWQLDGHYLSPPLNPQTIMLDR